MGETGILAALPMNEFIFFINNVLLAGLIIGSIYALGAIGVTLIFGILASRISPHGDMMTDGRLLRADPDRDLPDRRRIDRPCPPPSC